MLRKVVALAGAALTACAASTAGAAAIPNPCTALSAAVLTKALGSAPKGTPSSQPASGASIKTCTYVAGATTLRVSLGPKVVASGGFGGAPGMVLKKEPVLGPQGRLAYDTNPKFTFATVTFVKGAYYGGVWSNRLSAAQVVALAKSLYAGLR